MTDRYRNRTRPSAARADATEAAAEQGEDTTAQARDAVVDQHRRPGHA